MFFPNDRHSWMGVKLKFAEENSSSVFGDLFERGVAI